LDPNGRIMSKRGRGLSLHRDIKRLRKEFDGKTQAVRGFLIAELEELAKIAAENAQRASGKGKAKVKQNWMRMMAYIAQTVTYVASEYDSAKIDARLDVLERLVRELKQAKKN